MALKMKWCAEVGAEYTRDSSEITFCFEVWEDDAAARATNCASVTNYVTFIETAVAHVQANNPTVIGNLFQESISIQEDDRAGRLMLRLTYTPGRPPNMLRWGHDTTGGTLHITHSYATASYYPSGARALSFGGAIGVNGDEVEGVDRVIPALRLNARFMHLSTSATIYDDTTYLNYSKMVAGMTGTTNASPIWGFEQGELLFLGSVGDFTPGHDNEFDYVFLASKNATGLTIAQTILNVAKKGHDYLWLRYAAGENDDGDFVTSKPLACHVERIYEGSEFSALGIGT